MNPALMPKLTADNNSPLLWNAVLTLMENGIDTRRVRFLLSYPESNTHELKEIFHQKPDGYAALTPDTAIEVTVNPGVGYFVDTKQEWYRKYVDGNMTIDEVSNQLLNLGKIQLLLRSPTELVNALLSHCWSSDSPFSENGLCFDEIFSDSERMALATLLSFKRNSYLPTILSQMFTQILNIDFRFMETLNNHFPQILAVRVNCTQDVFRKCRNKVAALENLLVPITCRLIYIFQFPVAILNEQNAILDNVQLG